MYGIANQQIYLNHKAVNEDKEKLSEIKNKVKNFIMKQQGIMNVVDLENLNNTTLQDYLKSLIENGYNPQRSGDLYYVMNPAWMEDFTKGTTHGTSFKYDTHIPLLWYGWNVKPGKDYSLVSMTDIAATIASLLHIQEPNGCIGKPIIGLMK